MSMLAPITVVIGLGIMAAIAVSGTFMGETGPILDARLQAADRISDLNGTSIELVGADYAAGVATLDFRNVGRTPWRDTSTWDVWVRYHDATVTSQAWRLTRASGPIPANDEWALDGIYIDAANGVAEAFQPRIVDPAEEMRLLLDVDPVAADPQDNSARLGLSNGVTAKVYLTWEALALTPADINWGGAITNSPTALYVLRGDNSNAVWRYNIASNTWTDLTNFPFTPTAGAALAFAEMGGNEYLYAFRGQDQQNFHQYDVTNGGWNNVADPPNNVDDGAALAWDGNNTIYALAGNDTQTAWKYNIALDTWSAISNTPANVFDGGALTFVDGALYAFGGDVTTNFWRYTEASGAWTALSGPPVNVDGGGALTNDGKDIFAFTGGTTDTFLKYSVARDTWTAYPEPPLAVGWGGALTTLNDVVYGLRGENNQEFWKYPLPTFTP